ncbi:MAG: peptidylprolyl isomerase [Hyphomicrobiales bacterium]
MSRDKKFSRSALIGFAFLGVTLVSAPLVSAAIAQENDKVLATVDGEQITEKDIALAKVLLGESLQQIPENEQRKRIIELLVETYLLANAAERSGVRETDAYKRRIKFLDLRALRDSYVESEVRSKISDDDVKKRYSLEVAKLSPEVEVHARHILVENEADAAAIIKELDNGADFVELAKTKSAGPSGPSGGDLGFFPKGRMVPEFDEVVFTLKPGTYTPKPVKTQFGWHVIKVEAQREVPVPPLEEVAEQIKRMLASERYATVIDGLRNAAKVKVFEK